MASPGIRSMKNRSDLARACSHMHDGIGGFCVTAENAANCANLGLLRDVDETVAHLHRNAKLAHAHARIGVNFLDQVRACVANVKDSIGGDSEEVCSSLEAAENAVKATIALLRQKQAHAFRDPALKDHNEEMVVDAYNEAISENSRLHDILVDLRWAILEFESEQDAVSGEPVSTLDELLIRLKG